MGYVWSPLAPSPSGVANYTETLIAGDPALEELTFVTEHEVERTGRNAVAPDGRVLNAARNLLQLGNNMHHSYVMDRAIQGGAIVELHDLSLHKLHSQRTLHQSDFPGYMLGLQENEGEWGRRAAYQRSQGYFTPRLECYMRANRQVCERARALIVHSRWARFQIELQEIETPIHVLPHYTLTPEESQTSCRTKQEAREKLGLASDRLLIISAGDVVPFKRLDWVLAAFEMARGNGLNAELVIAGACEMDDVEFLLEESPNAADITVTGRLDQEAFDDHIMAADLLPEFRFPSVGESSATAARALGFGRVMMVPEYA
ncbi:MAG: glycosyltransferase, partial [Pseudomonadota bacterium]